MKRAHVIGMGEVGRRLSAALERAGWEVLPVTHRTGWDRASALDDPSPRIVAVREETLAEVLERVPAGPRSHLVLVQNGFLEARHDGIEAITRGLIWFTSKGEFFRTLGPSFFHGPHAADLVVALARGGIRVERLTDRDAFRREMIVKGIWNCVVGLPLAVHQVELGSYLRDRRDELRGLVEESARAAGAEYGVSVEPEAALEVIFATTAELGWVRGGAKALPWRNGAIATFGRRHDIPTPVNNRLLRAVGYSSGDEESSAAAP